MWFAIADKLRSHQCFERNKTGRCNCRLRRGKHKGSNPCNYCQTMIDACDGFTSGITPLDVVDYLSTKRCRNKSCNHKGCTETDRLVSTAVLPVAA